MLDPGGGSADGLGARLLRLATEGGARSLGVPTGVLREGAPADFFTVDLHHPSLAGADRATVQASIVFGAEKSAVQDVVVAGRRIVSEGRHALAHESGRAFTSLVRRVFG